MREQGKDDKTIKKTRRAFNMEISNFKEKSIQQILDLHPDFYNPIVDFDNWKSAMKYLEDNQHFVLQLLNQEKDDKKTS
tara:strand:- start:1688 stop:1924 length:237 start_codon:yes stop_codon:yes gene_type:complete